MAEEKSSAYIHISGIVQGVGFRFFTEDVAREIGITGYVRNCTDGSVEAYAEGQKPDILTFIDYLRRGPRSARVMDIRVEWDKTQKGYRDFRITY